MPELPVSSPVPRHHHFPTAAASTQSGPGTIHKSANAGRVRPGCRTPFMIVGEGIHPRAISFLGFSANILIYRDQYIALHVVSDVQPANVRVKRARLD
jgi:hypothetical protein